MAEHVDRRIEGNFSQGWPMAIFITALAVLAFVAAGMIHRATFRSPNDVTAEYRHQPVGGEAADPSHGSGGH